MPGRREHAVDVDVSVVCVGEVDLCVGHLTSVVNRLMKNNGLRSSPHSSRLATRPGILRLFDICGFLEDMSIFPNKYPLLLTVSWRQLDVYDTILYSFNLLTP